MLVDLQTLEEVKQNFIELGVAVSNLSTDVESSITSVSVSLSKMQRSLSDAVDTEAISQIAESSNDIAKLSDDFSEMYEKFSGIFGGLDAFGDALKDSGGKFEDIAKRIEKVVAPAQAKPPQDPNTKKKKKKKKKKGKPGLLAKEAASAKGKFKSMWSALQLPVKGAVLAGGLAWMAYGFKDADRVRAESGEAMNILVAAYDGTVDKMVRIGTNYLSSFQENMQKFYGIGKGEVQAVAKAFTEGGVSIEEMLSGLDRRLGMVGKNFYTFALGVDKLYELSGGATASRMVEYAHSYGKSMEGAKRSVEGLYAAGQASGLGTQSFVGIVERSSESLKDLGFDIDQVSDLAVKMQAIMEDMNVPKKFAGSQMARGLEQLTSGIASMNEGWKAIISREMGYGEGIEGVQKFDEAFSRVLEKQTNEDELENLVVTTVNTVMGMVQNDEVQARRLLNKEMGWGFEGARNALLLAEAVNKGSDKGTTAKQLKDFKKLLKNSLETEREKMSKFQRHMNKWMKGISEIGQGLLGMITNFLADLVGFFKFGLQVLVNKIEGGADAARRNRELAQSFADLQEGKKKYTDQYKDLLKSGWKKLKGAGKSMGMEIFKTGGGFDALEQVWDWDPTAGSNVVSPTAPSLGTGATLPSTVQLVPIPMSGGAVQEVSGIPEEIQSMVDNRGFRYGQGPATPQEFGWHGGSLSIVSKGVDQSGNIHVGLVGNCPKCGLKYGEGFDEESYRSAAGFQPMTDLDVLTQMLYTEGGPGKIYKKKGKEELTGIAFTALNRMKTGRYGDTLMDVITSGQGFGKQGYGKGKKKRAYGTAREMTSAANQREYKKVRELAEQILEGEVESPVGSATHFIHNTFGRGYGVRGEETALPKFAEEDSGMKNVSNIGTARFYSRKGKDVKERQAIDERYRQRFHEANQGKAEAEPWEDEAAQTVME